MVAKDQGETVWPHNCSIIRSNLVIFALIILIALYFCSPSMDLHQAVKDSIKHNTQYGPTQYSPTQYKHYINKVKQWYKAHLPDVAQSFWLPTNMHTFIQLSLTNRDKPRAARVDQYSANQRIESE